MRNQTRRTSRRGAAAVELAIMMVFLVPTFMYVLFLQDLLWYKLEMQETIVSTPWDYSFLDWNQFKMKEAGSNPPEDNSEESGSSAGGGYDPTKADEKPPTYQAEDIDNVVARNSRRTYCDHTSAYDGSVQYDCKDQHHHTNYAAHQCWLVGSGGGNGAKGQQVTCGREKDSVLAIPGVSSFNDDFNAGGTIRCYARLGVTNYFLPQKFFDFWSKKDVTTMKRFGGNSQVGSSGNQSTHGDASGVTGEGGAAVIFATQYFSVMHDPWAVNRPAAINPDDGGGCMKDPDSRFRERVKSYWTIPGLAGTAQALMWNLKMFQDNLLSPLSNCDAVGDLLPSAPLAWKPDKRRQFGSKNFDTSGFDDTRQSGPIGSRVKSYYARTNFDSN
jgi:hypothetical protein